MASRLNEMRNDDAGNERKGGYYFKINDGFSAHLTYFFEIIHTTDAQCDGKEDDGKYENLDDFNEVSAQYFHLYCGRRIEMPQQNTCDDGNQNPEGKVGDDLFQNDELIQLKIRIRLMFSMMEAILLRYENLRIHYHPQCHHK